MTRVEVWQYGAWVGYGHVRSSVLMQLDCRGGDHFDNDGRVYRVAR